MVFNCTIRQQLIILANCALEKQKLIVQLIVFKLA